MPLWILYAVLIVTLIGSYLRVLPPMIGLGVMALVVTLGSVWFSWALFRLSVLSQPEAQKVLLTQFVFPAGLFWMLLMATSFPTINDVSTDAENPPGFEHLNRPSEYPSAVAEVVKKNYPKIEPLVLTQSASQVFDEVVKMIEENPTWKLVHAALESGTIEATQESSLFGFVDDVSIRIRSVGKDQTRVDMRSRSRLGRNDFGANAKRILMFYEGILKRVQK